MELIRWEKFCQINECQNIQLLRTINTGFEKVCLVGFLVQDFYQGKKISELFWSFHLRISWGKVIGENQRKTLAPEISILKQLCDKVNNRVPSRLEFQDLHSTAGPTFEQFIFHLESGIWHLGFEILDLRSGFFW